MFKMTFSSIPRKRQKKDSTLHESMPMALAQKTQTLSSQDRSFFFQRAIQEEQIKRKKQRLEMHERGFRVKKDFIISGRGEGEEGGNPNLGLGFTSDIQLLDAKGKNTSNVNTTAPWDTVTTRTDHGLELSKSLLHGNSGLIYLVQTTHLTHFILFSSFFGGKKVGWVDGFCFSITSELFLFCCCNKNFNPKPSTKSANTHHTQHNSLST
jgi:hypothetical protein